MMERAELPVQRNNTLNGSRSLTTRIRTSLFCWRGGTPTSGTDNQGDRGTDFRMAIAAVGQKECDQRPHAVEIGAIQDRSPLAGSSYETGTCENRQMRRQRIVGAVDRGGDCAGSQCIGGVADQQSKDFEPGGLAERRECRKRMRR